MSNEARTKGVARRGRLRRIAGVVALSGLALGSLGFVFALGGWFALRTSVRVPTVEVPRLVGLSDDDARLRVAAAGLELEIGGSRTDAIKAPGRVLEQSPIAGSSTKPGRAVRVVLSRGPAESLVPELVGSSLRRAQIALQNADFRLATRAAAPHDRIGVGRIVAQHPPAGSVGLPGEGASVLLSSGRKVPAYVMPSLSGWPINEAVRALERRGFKRIRRGGPLGRARTMTGEEALRAVVISQDPRPGHKVTLETRVSLMGGLVTLAPSYDQPPRARPSSETHERRRN